MGSLIIFDLDGTLYDFDNSGSSDFSSSKFYKEIKNNAYNFISRKFGVDKNESRNIYEKVKNDFNGELSLGMESRYGIDRYEWFNSAWDLNPADFLKRVNLKPFFSSLDSKIAILTGAPNVWASRVLDYFGLSEYKQNLFTGEPDIRKPNPEIFKQICNKMNVSPERAISIGDQLYTDILPAKEVGMKTVLLKSKSEEADYCVKSLNEIPKLTKEILKCKYQQ